MHRHRSLHAVLAAALSALSVACTSDDGPPSGVAGQDSALTLYWEGSCNFLACCSCYRHEHDTQVPGSFSCAGVKCAEAPKCGDADPKKFYVPNFACTQEDASCNDDDAWLVLPKVGGECGKEYLVCSKGKTVRATVKDASDKNQLYEASTGVMTALGVAPKANPKVKIYTDPDDPAALSDPECGCCGPPCSKKKPICECKPEGQGVCTGNLGSPTFTYPNGVVQVYSGAGVSVSKNGVPCYTAEVAGPFSMTDFQLAFKEPGGALIGIVHMNFSTPNTARMECDGKSYTVDKSSDRCQSIFMPPMQTQCPPPGQ